MDWISPPEEFYQRLSECHKLPSTSQPSPEAFEKAFNDARDAGDELIAILLSGKISGTYQSAQIAASLVDYDKIYLIDGLSATLGNQLLVRLAVELRDEVRSAGEIVSIQEEEKHKVRLLTVVDDLKYFRKGGRFTGAEAFAGAVLGIKPVVGMKDGHVALVGKARGLPGAYVALFKQLDQDGGLDPDKRYLAGYTAHHRAMEPGGRIRRAIQGIPTCPPWVCPKAIAPYLAHGQPAKGIHLLQRWAIDLPARRSDSRHNPAAGADTPPKAGFHFSGPGSRRIP